jgi:hypothetical protein
MSRLSFAPVSDAFKIGSEQINNKQDEINRLKKIVESKIGIESPSQDPTSYQRIGQPDKVMGTFCDSPENMDYVFFKMMKNPDFENLVKNYVTFKHPEWLLTNTVYYPSPNQVLPKVPEQNVPGNQLIQNNYSKENFGNVITSGPPGAPGILNHLVNLILYSSSPVKNYIILIAVTMLLYSFFKN